MGVTKLVFVVIFGIVVINNYGLGKVSESLKVTLPHGGGLIGRYLTSLSGRGIKAFLSVPYAEPPIGDLRFQPPVPKLPWEGFIPAVTDNKVCVQIFGDVRTGIVVGDEDCLYLNVYTPQSQYYFPNNHVDFDQLKNLTDFFSDCLFLAGFDEFNKNRLVDNSNSADTFVYLFSHRGEASFTDLMRMMFDAETNKEYGVCHADDLLYLFPEVESLLPTIAPTKLDKYVQAIMTQMWVNFATTGHPTPKGFPHGFMWKKAKGYPLNYLRVGNYKSSDKPLIAMEEGLYEERLNLWRKINSIDSRKPSKTEL